uniref:Uncharacterized protein n=1 Tax=Anguilla anguilla TaxID=7936 RepID=A0A0E9W7X0_ANGAN
MLAKQHNPTLVPPVHIALWYCSCEKEGKQHADSEHASLAVTQGSLNLGKTFF